MVFNSVLKTLAVSIPFDTAHVTAHLNVEDCLSATNQNFTVCVCAVALCLREVSQKLNLKLLLWLFVFLFNVYCPLRVFLECR